MAVITISLTPEGLKEFAASWPDELERVKREIAQQFQKRGRALVEAELGRWQTGKLAKSLVAYPSARGIDINIGSGIEHADYVFFGAEPHIIRPTTGKALSWSRYGKRFAYAWVKHPGQPARTDILNALEGLFLDIVEDEIETMIKTLAMASGASASDLFKVWREALGVGTEMQRAGAG